MHRGRQIVTLTTDWCNSGSRVHDADAPVTNPIGDHYVAQLKSILYQISATISIIDVSHKIQAFNAAQAAYVLKSVYRLLPQGSIHFVGVNSEPSPNNKPIFIIKDGHYFIGANDGTFSMVIDGEPEFACEPEFEPGLGGFGALELFAIIVKHIADGEDPKELGKPCKMRRDIVSGAVYDESGITGSVMFIDSYGNVITNISRDLFELVGRQRAFKIFVQNSKRFIDHIAFYYDDVPEYHHVALFNSSGMLEIAVRNANMAQLENLDTRSTVRITFDGTRLF